MQTLTLLVLFAALLVAAALITGIGSMAHGGRFDRAHGHQLMLARVGFQGLALVLILIALVVALR